MTSPDMTCDCPACRRNRMLDELERAELERGWLEVQARAAAELNRRLEASVRDRIGAC